MVKVLVAVIIKTAISKRPIRLFLALAASASEKSSTVRHEPEIAMGVLDYLLDEAPSKLW